MQGHVYIQENKLVIIKQFCAAFAAARESTTTDFRVSNIPEVSFDLARQQMRCYAQLYQSEKSYAIVTNYFAPK